MNIPESQRNTYLEHALDLNDTEKAKVAEYADWLPPTIIDAHAHSNLLEHVEDIPEKTYHHMMSSFPSFSIEESERIKQLFFPRTEVKSLRFAHVFKGIAHKAANNYLLENAQNGNAMALYGLPEDPAYTIDMLANEDVKGLKMYYSYLEPTATQIYQIFKPEILAAAQEHGVPIILHTPKVITESADDVMRLAEDFPDLKISIAHLGSSKFDIPGLQDTYDQLAEGTNAFLDTALNPSVAVCKRALQTFGYKRIMYGSDEPLNLLRSVPYIHPELGQRITTEHHYHWQDPKEHQEYNHLASGAIHSQWLCLDALKIAIQQLPSDHQAKAKQAIFHDNAAHLFEISKQ